MDNYYAIECVLQMAKAWSNMQTDLGFPTDRFDDEAIIVVEEMMRNVEEEAAA